MERFVDICVTILVAVAVLIVIKRGVLKRAEDAADRVVG